MKLLLVSLSLLLGFLATPAAMAAAASASANVKVVQKFFEEMGSRKNAKALSSLVSKSYTQSFFPSSQSRSRTSDTLSTHLSGVYAAMPDFKMTLNNVAGQNDVVFAHWTASGTRDGKPVKFNGISMFRLSGGKISDMVVAADPSMFQRSSGKK
jgi:ketosteroid isomerase-like protein